MKFWVIISVLGCLLSLLRIGFANGFGDRLLAALLALVWIGFGVVATLESRRRAR